MKVRISRIMKAEEVEKIALWLNKYRIPMVIFDNGAVGRVEDIRLNISERYPVSFTVYFEEDELALLFKLTFH